MTDQFSKAMWRSLDQTRAGNLAEATRVIQEALKSGGQTDLGSVGAVTQGRRLRDVIAALNARPEGVGLPPQPTRTRGLPDMPVDARLERRSYSGPTGSRDFRVYVPASAATGVAGVVVMLHGCTQTPEDFVIGTGMNAQAERHGFVVVWPEQGRSHNPSLCWNWFRPGDQGRGGEPAILHAIAATVATEFTTSDVFCAGLSAGGAMAAILGNAFPDLFRAVGIHSGLAPGSAHDVVSAFAAMRGEVTTGEALRPPAILFHGSDDRTVAPANLRALTGPIIERSSKAGQSVGRSYVVTEGLNASGSFVEVWSIKGAGHAWAGGHPDGSHTDPAGPDASAEMIRFFLRCKAGIR